MSWFKSQGLDLSGFAKNALAQAQKSIDKVLDIQANEDSVNGEEGSQLRSTKEPNKNLEDLNRSSKSKEVIRIATDKKKYTNSVTNTDTKTGPLKEKTVKNSTDDSGDFFASFLEESSVKSSKETKITHNSKQTSSSEKLEYVSKADASNIESGCSVIGDKKGKNSLEKSTNETSNCNISLSANSDTVKNYLSEKPNDTLEINSLELNIKTDSNKSMQSLEFTNGEPQESSSIHNSSLSSLPGSSIEQISPDNVSVGSMDDLAKNDLIESLGNDLTIIEPVDMDIVTRNIDNGPSNPDKVQSSSSVNDLSNEGRLKLEHETICEDVNFGDSHQNFVSIDTLDHEQKASKVIPLKKIEKECNVQPLAGDNTMSTYKPQNKKDEKNPLEYSDAIEEDDIKCIKTLNTTDKESYENILNSQEESSCLDESHLDKKDTLNCNTNNVHKSVNENSDLLSDDVSQIEIKQPYMEEDYCTNSVSIAEGNKLTDLQNNGKVTQDNVRDHVSKKEMENQMEIDGLKKEMSMLKEIVNAREAKMVALSKENIDMQEMVAILKSQLLQSESNQQEDDSEMEEMRQEFARRISDADKNLVTVTKERNGLQQLLEETELRFTTRIEEQETVYNSRLRQKEEQIVGLLEEGEKLSKKELKSNQMLKKMKAKITEQEKQLKEIREKLEEKEKGEKDHLDTIANGKEKEKNLKENVASLERLIDSQEDEITKLKDQLDDAEEKQKELQTNLDSAFLELRHVSSEKAQQISEVQEATMQTATKEKEELQRRLDETTRKANLEKDKMQHEIENLQRTISRLSNSMTRKEEDYKEELQDAINRLQAAESRKQDLSQSITAATRPLLRQIESLQNSLSSQAENWERVEKNHAEKIAALQQQLAFASEKERGAVLYSSELKARTTVLEDGIQRLKTEKEDLLSSEKYNKEKIHTLEDILKGEREEAEKVQSAFKKTLHDLENDKIFLEQQLFDERARVEAEISRVSSEMFDERVRLSRESSEVFATNEPVQNDACVFNGNPTFTARSRSSSTSSSQVVSDTTPIKGTSTALLERLQSQLRQKDGEIMMLKDQTQSLEQIRSSLAQELLNMSSKIEELEVDRKEIEVLKLNNEDLKKRYTVTLQMYGEKAEEADELRMDLEDVKQMYRQQIQDLFSSR